MRKPSKELVWVGLSAVLLIGAGLDRLSLRAPEDPAPYQARVFAASAMTPKRVGPWIGEDMPVPPEAQSQLHPNVFISRQYHNTLDGRYVGLLLVQCMDVRDLVPHYPPICYPGRGLSEIGKGEPKDWPAGNLTVTGMEYQFESTTFQTDRLTIVDNFMVLPDGRVCRDMDQVRKQVALNTRFFGAAQVQLVFQSDVSADERAKICGKFIAAYLPLIETIRSGVHR